MGKRLIDADKFMKEILTDGIGKTIIEYSERDIGYMIRRQPTVDAAEVLRNQWTSVKDKLPKKFEPVIVCREGGKVEQGSKMLWIGGRFTGQGPRRLPTGCRCRSRRRSDRQMLEIVPITLAEANAFVEQHHRHHKPVVGHKFSIGCADEDRIVGVAIVGRPVARHLDDGWTLEVNRLCTDGTKNACSMLYAAAWRAARAMGYKKIVTYILASESGTSLKAAGWKCVGKAGGLRWTGKRRPEVDLYPAQMKIRLEMEDKP